LRTSANQVTHVTATQTLASCSSKACWQNSARSLLKKRQYSA